MNLSHLTRLAEGATPGPWHACGQDRGGCICLCIWSKPADTHIATAAKAGDDSEGACAVLPEQAKINAQFIAAASPQMVLRLLAVANAAQLVHELVQSHGSIGVEGDLTAQVSVFEELERALLALPESGDGAA